MGYLTKSLFCSFLFISFFITNSHSQQWFATEKLTDSHDPTVIRDERSVYTLMTTNNLLEIRQSTDMQNWSKVGNIFAGVPAWIKTSLNANVTDIWAPHISFRNNVYWVYYCASSFGTNNSVIGVATNPTLDTKSPTYKWTDLGEVFKTTTSDNFNAIDPEIIVSPDNVVWLAFGSWWSGIKMIAIDPMSGKRLVGNNTIYPLANRGGSGIEGPSLIQHNGYFYLFTSWDACCKGTSSTYRTMAGRSNSVTGPYVDKQNKQLNLGGSDELIKGYGRYFGPGGGSPFKDGRRDYYALHYYNGNENGAPRLQLKEIVYDDSNWPVITQPFLGRRQSFEAEHAQLTNATIITGINASNKEYVGNINFTDSKVTFHINALTSGEYTLRIRYATGEATSSHFLQVNNSPKVELKYLMNAYGQFPAGQILNQVVILKEGYNALSFTKGTLFAELDRIDLVRNASSKIEGGSFDNFLGSAYKPTGNNVQIGSGNWIMFENLNFENGGIKNLSVGLGTECAGQFKINIDGINGSTSSTFSTSSSNKLQNFTLPISFQNLTGVHDIYLSQISGNCEIDYLQFATNITTGNLTSIENKNCSVTPNPFTNRIRINSPGQFNFSILNISGETMLSGTGEDEKEIITDFPSGIYFIKNQHRTGSKTFKIVKE